MKYGEGGEKRAEEGILGYCYDRKEEEVY